MNLSKWLRSNIRDLKPYVSARSTFNGAASIFLDANENAFVSVAGKDYNRYPDAFQRELKQKIASIKGISEHKIFIGNGSDEPIDLLIRMGCNPGVDSILTFVPTYGMYEVAADINNIAVTKIALGQNFEFDIDAALGQVTHYTKIIFVCTPNNPTGNLMPRESVEQLLNGFEGMVVVDEAYINFAGAGKSCLPLLEKYENLVVLQTFSKAWGMAGLRLGMAFAAPAIIDILNKIKPPYNISTPVQQLALAALQKAEQVNQAVKETNVQRARLTTELAECSFVIEVYPSVANFLLVKVEEADVLYRYLLQQGIVVRNRSSQPGCKNCIRITVGTKQENDGLLAALQKFDNNKQP